MNQVRNALLTILMPACLSAFSIFGSGCSESPPRGFLPPHIVVVLPGQSFVPGRAAQGTPLDQISGQPFDVTLYAVDSLGQVNTDFSGSVGLTSSVSDDGLPGAIPAALGVATLTVTAYVAGTGRVLTSVDLSPEGLASSASTQFAVVPAPASALVTILPGEILMASAAGPTVSGPPDPQVSATSFDVQVAAVDGAGNIDVSATGLVSLATSDLLDTEPSAASLVGGEVTFTVAPVLAQASANVTATHAGLGVDNSSFFQVRSRPADRLFVLLPGQAVVVSSLGPSVTGPIYDQTVGVTFVVQVVASDPYGNPDGFFSQSVSLTTTDPNDLDPLSVTLSAGQGSQNVMAATTMTGETITASKSGLTSGTSDSFDVLFGGADRLLVLLPGQNFSIDSGGVQVTGAAPSQTVGSAFTVEIRAIDFFGNVDTGLSGSVTVETTGDSLDTDPGSASMSSGAASAQVTHKLAATQDVSVTGLGLNAGTSDSYTVNAGTAAGMTVVLPGQSVAPTGSGCPVSGSGASQIAGQSLQVDVVICDVYGNVVDDNGRQVTLYTDISIDGLDTDGLSDTTVSGWVSFQHTPIKARTDYEYLVVDGLSVLSDANSSTFAVDAAATKFALLLPGQSLVVNSPGFTISGSPTGRQTGAAFTASVRAVDVYGNVDVNQTRNVSLTTSDLLDTNPSAKDMVSGIADFQVTNVTQAASNTVTATDTSGIFTQLMSSTYAVDAVADRLVVLPPGQSLSVSAGGPSITGTPSGQQAGTSFSVSVRATDAYGNVDTDSTVSTTASTPGDGGDTEPASQALVAGAKSFTVTPMKARNDYTVQASASGLTTGTSASINVIASTLSRLLLTLPGEGVQPGPAGPTYVPVSGPLPAGLNASATVQSADVYGNFVGTSTTEVTVTGTDAQATNPAPASLSSGTQSFLYKPYTAGSLTLTATDSGGSGLTTAVRSGLSVSAQSASDLFIVFPGETLVATSGGAVIQGSDSPQLAGQLFSFDVKAVDPYGNVDTAATNTVNILTDDPLDTEPADADLVSGSVSFDLTPGTTGPVVVTASDANPGSLSNSMRSFRSYPVFLGQPDGVTAGTGDTADALSGPVSVALDNSVTPPRVWVSDKTNSRVLGWHDASLLADGLPADTVLGQTDFGFGACNQGGSASASTLCNPEGVAVDLLGNVWVADTGNHRVLRYDSPATSDGVADLVLGQGVSFTANSANQGGSAGAGTLSGPRGVAVKTSGDVFVADSGNNRVLQYAAPVTSGQSAGFVLGQSGFTGALANRGGSPTSQTLSDPTALFFDTTGNLFAADTGNSRALRYSSPQSNDQAANLVLGHAVYTDGSSNQNGIGAATLSFPGGLAMDESNQLWVADGGNNRALRYPAALNDGVAAALVAGQPSGNFTANSCNQGGAVAEDTLCAPKGLSYWNGALFVVDSTNNRVTVGPR